MEIVQARTGRFQQATASAGNGKQALQKKEGQSRPGKAVAAPALHAQMPKKRRRRPAGERHRIPRFILRHVARRNTAARGKAGKGGKRSRCHSRPAETEEPIRPRLCGKEPEKA